MLCACTQHVMELFLLVHDQSYYNCLAQLPLPCQTIGLPSVARQSIPVQLEPMQSTCACKHVICKLYDNLLVFHACACGVSTQVKATVNWKLCSGMDLEIRKGVDEWAALWPNWEVVGEGSRILVFLRMGGFSISKLIQLKAIIENNMTLRYLARSFCSDCFETSGCRWCWQLDLHPHEREAFKRPGTLCMVFFGKAINFLGLCLLLFADTVATQVWVRYYFLDQSPCTSVKT